MFYLKLLPGKYAHQISFFFFSPDIVISQIFINYLNLSDTSQQQKELEKLIATDKILLLRKLIEQTDEIQKSKVFYLLVSKVQFTKFSKFLL